MRLTLFISILSCLIMLPCWLVMNHIPRPLNEISPNAAYRAVIGLDLNLFWHKFTAWIIEGVFIFWVYHVSVPEKCSMSMVLLINLASVPNHTCCFCVKYLAHFFPFCSTVLQNRVRAYLRFKIVHILRVSLNFCFDIPLMRYWMNNFEP